METSNGGKNITRGKNCRYQTNLLYHLKLLLSSICDTFWEMIINDYEVNCDFLVVNNRKISYYDYLRFIIKSNIIFIICEWWDQFTVWISLKRVFIYSYELSGLMIIVEITYWKDIVLKCRLLKKYKIEENKVFHVTLELFWKETEFIFGSFEQF